MTKSGNRVELESCKVSGGDLDRRWWWASICVALLFGGLILVKMSPVAGGADASGYMNFARLLDDGRMTDELRLPEGNGFEEIRKTLFQPLGATYREETGRLSPIYPIGLPLLLSLGGLHEWEFGVRFAYAVVGALACLGIWFLATELKLSAAWRFFAVVVLASSPLFLWSSLILMSDALAACQAIWVMYFALKGRGAWSRAGVCGFLIGWAVLTRPSSVLLFLPVLPVMDWRIRAWRSWVALGLGGAPALVLFLWSNWTLFGDPLQSGYGDLWSLFSWDYALESLLHYARVLPYAVFGLVLPGALVGACCLSRWDVRVLLYWTVPVFAFYAFYFFTSQTWWFLRFVLVGIPGLILLCVLALQRITQRFEGYLPEKRVVGVLALASVLAGVYWLDRLSVFGEQDFEQRYLLEAEWVNKNLAEDTLIVCMQPSGAFYYYTDFPIFRWDLARTSDWEAFESALETFDGEVVAVLHAFEEERPNSALKQYPDRWSLIEEVTPRIRAYRWQ